jgi:hypothetical protein
MKSNASHSNASHHRPYFSNDCHTIKPTNSSFADNWESIPETLILNSLIGCVLFILFVILTWIAWRWADSDDQLKTQNIITFLYGYRDPEHWYVIPRFEFLRHEDRHHKHDLQYPYIYVPPKLPLANPLELIALGNHDKEIEKSKSTDTERPLPSQPKQPADLESAVDLKLGLNSVQYGAKSPVNAFPKSPDRQTPKLRTLTRSPDSNVSDTSATTNPNSISSLSDGTFTSSDTPQPSKSAAPGNSHFYPSILTAEQLQASYLSRKLNKFFAIFFRVSDSDLIYARGIDAYEYLLFQRHLILIMLVTTILCVGVILPIHWIAGTSADPNVVRTTSFQRSTIKNIASMTNLHWAHIICSGVIVFTTLKVMSSYRESIITQDDPQISRRTLLIGNIPSEQRTRVKLNKVFREYFPRNTVEAIQFVYDTKPLVDDEMYLSSIIAAKQYCIAYKRKSNSEIYVHKTDVNQSRVCDGYCRLCSFIYVCCCYWPLESKEPGTTYYAKEEAKFRQKIAAACEKLVREPSEYAFVTFKSYKQARRVMSELATLKQDAIEGRLKQRSVSRTMRSVSFDLDKSRARARRRRKKAGNGADDDDDVAKLPRSNSKFIETSASDSDVKDPLDPKNNPHVRSIRSPIRVQDKGAKTAGMSASSATGPEAGPNTKELAVKSIKSAKALADKKSKRSAMKQTADHQEVKPLEGPLAWSVRYAPHPDNVEFDDLLNLARTSRWTIVLLHFLMIIIFIFITTPNVILSMIERISVIQPDKAVELTGFQKLTINYLSILLQIVTTAILPALVTLISKQIPYEDSSTKSHSVMWKVYSFLILMVIVMPSIGMSSAQALFETDIDPKCLFPTDNGAYYVNYVVSSIFLSTILELIKPVDIVFYYFILWTSRSSAEIESGRQFIDREFSVGMQHTDVLLIFSVVMTYSISCPLIAPVGLVYLCVKHAVDHYNLYYSYFTKKVDKDLQTTIVIFVKVALLLMLFQTTVAIYINTGTSYFSLLSQMIFWVTLATLGFNCFFDCTARTLTSQKRTRYNHEFCACFYLPKVIASLLRLDAIPPTCISRKV